MKTGWVSGKTAIVTGAASGIGRAVALRLAEEGATVWAADIDAAGLATLPGVTTAVLDAREEAGWEVLVADVLAKTGRLDILANCAGIQLSKGLLETSLDDLHRVLGVNLDSVFLGTRTAVRAMLPQGEGSIINIASNYANIADGLNAAYCASKAAVAHFTKAAALDCAGRGTRIRVNSVHPGCIATPMLEREIVDVAARRGDPDTSAVRAEWNRMAPLGIGTAEQVADAVLYLASDRSAYTTGAELVLDGGHIIR
ncbi:SDR family NAD(P)-dependent oxidoreductase [Tabrizicola oligotrophica]|uniref:SDR family oxidoreductase n=1 Tax=Tabrizicola oligotrophica TaxID=2710650 RepID=A0A6M0QWC4_9RHOB|nr:SDR family oxidoreductase [Tabrizicola oligotrophica]NEY91725.1 SDR family oxidoreductase [Tabrizicola oligotrophica]